MQITYRSVSVPMTLSDDKRRDEAPNILAISVWTLVYCSTNSDQFPHGNICGGGVFLRGQGWPYSKEWGLSVPQYFGGPLRSCGLIYND